MNRSIQHLHKYELKGEYLVCDCGKKILNFKENDKGIKTATRKDGKKYTKKSNTNRFLFPDEYFIIMKHLKKRSKHTVEFLINTGVRIREGQLTEKTDLTYNKKGRSRLNIRFTKTKARKGEFKVGKPRLIPISNKFAMYLQKSMNDDSIKQKKTFNLLSTPALNIAVKKAAKEVGIDDYYNISAHTFRKTLEVWLMALGIGDLKLVAHIGHDIGTAASHYVSPDVLSMDDKMKIRHILGDLYND